MISPSSGNSSSSTSSDAWLPPDSPFRQLHSLSGPTTPTHERGGHIPYRNSMLTMVLKDSLGKKTNEVRLN